MSKYLVLVLFLHLGCSQSEINLVKKGATTYEILANSSDSLAYRAATELQSYIIKSSGVQLPIGEGEFSNKIRFELIPEFKEGTIGYSIQDNDLVFYGRESQDFLYAVYEFLEREIGVRFYSSDGEIIPELNDITLSSSLDFRYLPPVTTRTVHSRLFYENHSFADKLRVTHESFPRYVPEARVHTFHRFMPADEYYEEHPEYYALRNGKRLPTQLCLTNEKVYEIVKDRVGKMLEQYPNSSVISVSQDDNTLYCQCEHCEALHQKEGSPAGSMIHFVNRIARDFPEKTISTLAYQYTRKAPATLRPESNVLITLCSIECDRSAPIAEKCQDFTEDLRQWSSITDNVRIWDYTTQFTNYLAPFPNIHTLKPNIELFVENNAKWIFEQHSNIPSSLFDLRSYLTAKLLWDPTLDADSLIADFANGYYGAAGPFVVEYVDRLEEEIKKESDFFLFLYGDPAQAFTHFLSEENLVSYNRLFDQAIQSVKGNDALTRRVNMARIGVDFASLEYAKTKMSLLSEDQQKTLRERIQRFKETTEENDITMVNEMRLLVSEYLDGYEKILERAEKKNKAFKKPVILNSQPTKYANEDPSVLTDGAFGGTSFYANWLGFLVDCEAVIDLEELTAIHEINTAFLQVVNHVVFFPQWVEYAGSKDGKTYVPLGRVPNAFPLNSDSKVSDIQNFNLSGLGGAEYRYIRLVAKNYEAAPIWHHAAGNQTWIFLDEVEVR